MLLKWQHLFKRLAKEYYLTEFIDKTLCFWKNGRVYLKETKQKTALRFTFRFNRNVLSKSKGEMKHMGQTETKKRGTGQAVAAVIFLLLFAALIAVLKTVDVQGIGPNGSKVGLAAINGAFHDLTGVRSGLYELTDLLGKAAFLPVALFALLGLAQLLSRRSFEKVDLDLYLLAVFYVLVGLAYLFFEVCIINYRPVLMDGELEASFPSSHTMLAICVLGSAMIQFHRRIGNRGLRIVVNVICALALAALVAGRLFSGVHWLTDIIGGVLLGCGLLMIYSSSVAKADSIR